MAECAGEGTFETCSTEPSIPIHQVSNQNLPPTPSRTPPPPPLRVWRLSALVVEQPVLSFSTSTTCVDLHAFTYPFTYEYGLIAVAERDDGCNAVQGTVAARWSS